MFFFFLFFWNFALFVIVWIIYDRFYQWVCVIRKYFIIRYYWFFYFPDLKTKMNKTEFNKQNEFLLGIFPCFGRFATILSSPLASFPNSLFRILRKFSFDFGKALTNALATKSRIWILSPLNANSAMLHFSDWIDSQIANAHLSPIWFEERSRKTSLIVPLLLWKYFQSRCHQ